MADKKQDDKTKDEGESPTLDVLTGQTPDTDIPSPPGTQGGRPETTGVIIHGDQEGDNPPPANEEEGTA